MKFSTVRPLILLISLAMFLGLWVSDRPDMRAETLLHGEPKLPEKAQEIAWIPSLNIVIEDLKSAQQALTARDAKQSEKLLLKAADRIQQLSELMRREVTSPVSRTSEADPAVAAHQISEVIRELAAWSGNERFPVSVAPFLAFFEVQRARLNSAQVSALGFQTTYVGTRTVEPRVGGHASAPEGAFPASDAKNAESPEPRPAIPEVEFEEVAVIEQTTFCGGTGKDHLLESAGTGVALLDFDNDGWMDLFFVNAYQLTSERVPLPQRNFLYRNLGNWRFEDVSENAGIDLGAWGNGVCVGDFDNDGFLDLYVTNFGPNFLLRNNGDGTFTEMASRNGVDHPGWSTGCSFFDSNGNGLLDLYVANYVETSWEELFQAGRDLIWRGGPRVMVGPTGLPGAADVFFRNEGNGRFVDATRESGFQLSDRYYGFGVLTGDFHNGGRIDVYVANDSNPNFLFQNVGQGLFKEVGMDAGVALDQDGRAQAGMGADAGDFFGSGWLDLVVTNFARDSNTLYRNLGRGLFEDATRSSGLYVPSFRDLGWGAAFLDVNRNGWLDLFVVNGHIYPQVDGHPELGESYAQPNQILLNRGGRFDDVSRWAGSGLQERLSSRGLAVGDLDNDGALDLVITNIDDHPTLLRNRTVTDGRWLGLQLEKEGGNRFCIGCRVTLRSGNRESIREVRSGGSFLSQSDLRVYFGLGDHSGPVQIEVRSPEGNTWRFDGLATDQWTRLYLSGQDRIRTKSQLDNRR